MNRAERVLTAFSSAFFLGAVVFATTQGHIAQAGPLEPCENSCNKPLGTRTCKGTDGKKKSCQLWQKEYYFYVPTMKDGQITGQKCSKELEEQGFDAMYRICNYSANCKDV